MEFCKNLRPLFPVSSRPERSGGRQGAKRPWLQINPALAKKNQWFIIDHANGPARPTGAMSVESVTPRELRRLAEAMGCQTQQDLARALGITQARVSQILSGKYPVKRGALLTLIRQLQVEHQHSRKERRD